MNRWAGECPFDWLTFEVCIQLRSSWGVSWSVILDPELRSGREFESPNNLWASPTRRLWLTAALVWNNTPLKGRDRLNSVKWRGDGQQTKPAITTKWMSTDYWTLWQRWWIWPRPRSEAASRMEEVNHRSLDDRRAPWGVQPGRHVTTQSGKKVRKSLPVTFAKQMVLSFVVGWQRLTRSVHGKMATRRKAQLVLDETKALRHSFSQKLFPADPHSRDVHKVSVVANSWVVGIKLARAARTNKYIQIYWFQSKCGCQSNTKKLDNSFLSCSFQWRWVF